MTDQAVCTYQRGTWECRGDGYLWDADDDGWNPDEKDDPCPCCNTRAYLENAKEEAEGVPYQSNGRQAWTGADVWRWSVKLARRENPEAAAAAEAELCPVMAAVEMADGEEAVEIFEAGAPCAA